MITIDHEPGYAPMIFITGADTFKCDPAYYLGTDGRNNIPPNYPVPALTTRDALFEWALRAETTKQWKHRVILANIIT